MPQDPETRLGRFLADVGASCGPGTVLDDTSTGEFELDWTGRWHGRAGAVLRPHTPDDVVAIVRAGRRHHIALVPRGGGTGLVGGAVPTADGSQVVLDCRALGGISIDPLAGTALVGAGVTLAALNDDAAPYGLRFAVDIGSRGTATIGGMVATNAGGLRMLRYGDTAAQLLGVDLVTGAAERVVQLRGLTKDNVGLRWQRLVAGSEGALGVICQVLVALVPTVTASAHAWFPVPDAETAVQVAAVARHHSAVTAVEYVDAPGIELVAALTGRTPPTPGAAVIVEACRSTARGAEPTVGLEAVAQELAIVDEAVVGDGPAGWRLWEWRDRHSEAIATAGIPAKCDVAVPLGRWAEFHNAVPDTLAAVRRDLWAVRFGHIADGNLHVNILTGDGAAPPPAADDAIWQLAASLGGTVSAEHGIGIAKAPWLHLVRSAPEDAVIERIRHSFDPDGIMVPHLMRYEHHERS